jgi:hypothetical protein
LRNVYIQSNLPNTEELRTVAPTLELTEKSDTVASIVTHLLSIEARLRMACGLARDTALFVTKKGCGRNWKGNDKKGDDRKGDDRKGNDWKGDDRKGDDWNSEVICHGCGVKGHIKAKCRSKHKWAS